MTEFEKVGPALSAEHSARLKRWKNEVEILKYEVWQLHHHRALWREMRDALLQASPDEVTFLLHYRRLYGERQFIAIRRLVDLDRRSVSVAQLLTDLAEHPETMTRAHHLQLWDVETDSKDIRDKWLIDEAQMAFNRYADGDGDNVDPAAVRRDLEHWKATAGTIKKFVDKRIAHFAAIEDSEISQVTFDDLDEAIDTVAEHIRKYTLLFTASSIAMMEPQISGDWKRPFRNPLFPSFPY
jgi:hypothetical protein